MATKDKDTVRLSWRSKASKEAAPKEAPGLRVIEHVVISGKGPPLKNTPIGRLIKGQALEVVRALTLPLMRGGVHESIKGRAKLIYLDPPFLSKTDYKRKVTLKGKALSLHAYTDKFTREEYLDTLAPIIKESRGLLTNDGLIFVHCDWRASALLKLLLDEHYGADLFLNEIIWHYGGRGAKAVSSQFARNHDTILVYGRSNKSELKKIYSEKVITIKEALSLGYREETDGRIFKTAPRGDYTDKSIQKLAREGRVHVTSGGKERIKYFMETRGGKVIIKTQLGDVWSDIPDAMHTPLKERTGYGTQKPEALLKRIIESSTEEGDLVIDLFSGSGTTAATAAKLGRKWIASDRGAQAVSVTRTRLIEEIRHSKESASFTVEECGLALGSSSLKESTELKVSAKLTKEAADNGSGYLLKLSVDKYSPNAEAEYKRILKDNYGEDPRELIEYIAVDCEYDGEDFVSRDQYISRGDACEAVTIKLKARPGRVALLVSDLFGRVTIKEVKGL